MSQPYRLRLRVERDIFPEGWKAELKASDEQSDPLVGKERQPESLVQFFRESPLVGVELDLEREKDTGRDIEL